MTEQFYRELRTDGQNLSRKMSKQKRVTYNLFIEWHRRILAINALKTCREKNGNEA